MGAQPGKAGRRAAASAAGGQGRAGQGAGDALRPGSEDEVAQMIREAQSAGAPLEVLGGGARRGLGPRSSARRQLWLDGLRGIDLYEPEELVLQAGAGTPLAEARATLAKQGQRLPGDPPDPSWLYGEAGGAANGEATAEAAGGTLGGALATALNGPGALRGLRLRDALLGVRAVDGRGQVFHSGGRVVKNVTGYDLARSLAGSFGTLAAMTQVSLRLEPLPQASATLLWRQKGAEPALRLMLRLRRGPWDCASLCWLAPGCMEPDGGALQGGAVAARLEGDAEELPPRLDELAREGDGEAQRLQGEGEALLWRRLRDDPRRLLADAESLAGGGTHLWRIWLPATDLPAQLALTPQALAADLGGSLLWVWSTQNQAPELVARAGATLALAPEPSRTQLGLHHSASPQQALQQLRRRIKYAFDPDGVLSPGRMDGEREQW